MSDPAAPVVSLSRLAGELAITRLDPGAPIPAELWELAASSVVSVTRTERELSIVTPLEHAPVGEVDAPWVGWYVDGPIPFGTTGVVDSLVGPLARSRCPVFVVSTFDSDLLLVPADREAAATEALEAAGHRLT